jgi:hypothetical protein
MNACLSSFTRLSLSSGAMFISLFRQILHSDWTWEDNIQTHVASRPGAHAPMTRNVSLRRIDLAVNIGCRYGIMGGSAVDMGGVDMTQWRIIRLESIFRGFSASLKFKFLSSTTSWYSETLESLTAHRSQCCIHLKILLSLTYPNTVACVAACSLRALENVHTKR